MTTPQTGFTRATPPGDFAGLFDERTGAISPQIYTDPGLYQLELERLFSHAWLFIAHESQIPKTGNFFATYMAEDPVIAVRQKDATIKVILNQCRHRGMRLCRQDAGTARAFSCVYHGWGYDLAGNLVYVPQAQAYGALDKSKLGARTVPRVESYRGLIFANWDPAAPTLIDYLGDLTYYIDAALDRSAAGMVAYGGVFKWVIPANWKLAAEQSCSDMYHGETTHSSPTVAMLQTGIMQMRRGDRSGPPVGRQYRHEDQGHGTGFMLGTPIRDTFHIGLAGELIEGYDPGPAQDIAIARLGADRASHALQHLVVFPNFAIFDGACALRTWHPRGPDEFEFWSIGLVPADADAPTREQMRLANLRGLGPGGTLEADDGENWIEIQRVLRGYQSRMTPFTAQQGLNRPGIGADPSYPGIVDQSVISEEAARGFYARWLHQVSGAAPAPGRVVKAA